MKTISLAILAAALAQITAGAPAVEADPALAAKADLDKRQSVNIFITADVGWGGRQENLGYAIGSCCLCTLFSSYLYSSPVNFLPSLPLPT